MLELYVELLEKNYMLPLADCEGSNVLLPFNHLLSIIFILDSPVGMKLYLIAVCSLSCPLLMANRIELISMYIFMVCIYFIEGYLIRSLTHIKIDLSFVAK